MPVFLYNTLMQTSFWQTIDKPIIALSPMDGVTDVAMRHITQKYGKPSFTVTEFTSVEGINAGALRLMKDFKYTDLERPVLAQIFGHTPSAFYKAAIVVAALGFDGVDINMGCPAPSIQEHGAGAGLIRTPKLASEIIRAVQKGVKDWSEGVTLEKAEVDPEIIKYINETHPNVERRLIPVSVKTRTGYDVPVTEEWISHLLQHDLANITLHGRTLKQLYMGLADWDEIAKAAKLVKQTNTTFLGNGDILSYEDALEKIKKYNLDGVLIGRAAQGNPWFFKNHIPTQAERFAVAIEHAKVYEQLCANDHFLPMRKHLAWYIKGFDNASDLRQKLVMSNSSVDVEHILAEWQTSQNSQ
jgi:tRNA-dihydrouridine synthase B